MADVKWIKIVTDIFDNRKIKQIEKLPESDAIINIWFRLLCLAGTINEDGRLLLTKEVPYTDDMLVNEFNKSIEIIRLALNVLVKFDMIEIIDNIFCISNWQKYQNIDGLEKIKEQNRLRVAKHRSKYKELDGNITVTLPVTQSNAIDIDKELDIKNKKKSIYGEYKHVRLTDIELQSLKGSYDNYLDLIKYLDEYIEMKGYKAKSHYLCIKKWVVKAIKQNCNSSEDEDKQKEEAYRKFMEKGEEDE